MSSLDRAVSVHLEPLVGGFVCASVEGAPELRAIANNAERALARLGRMLDHQRRAAGAKPANLPVTAKRRARVALPVLGTDGRFHCGPVGADLTPGECATRHALANAPQPDAADAPAWAIARLENAACVECPIGGRHATTRALT